MNFQAPQFNPTQMPSNDEFTKMMMEMQQQKAQQQQGGGWLDLLGPVANLVGQTMDGKEGINWGGVGNALKTSAQAAAGAVGGPAGMAAAAGMNALPKFQTNSQQPELSDEERRKRNFQYM